ncbi:Heavy metal-associated isoprenylated plant protein 9 [Stylosanthes scabra]|uniref:Heavy metal-associated isoprenylated plant protein 9 n=1 Tax=Stylosanthes scabra TaxID=79078 RepID=A0ABU6Z9C5_9FABA|nr:Heavy metal-associated isoprenylated plant protein 9 [Stylosanthes scabra]
MGEEGKQEQPPKAESKPEEKPAEEKKEEKREEKPKEEKQEAKPPSPCVLFVDLHCMGCAKKIERYVMKMKGVEGVVINMAKNEVTIKGIVDPQAICNIITKKAKRRANVISLLPPAEGEAAPEVVTSQVSAPVSSVELNVNMHCEACAEQLKKKILKMKGVQAAVTEFSIGKITVTGTMDANKLVDYVYRCTKKQAKIVPQPEPEPEEKKEEESKETDKPAEEEAPAKAEEEKPAADEAKKEENSCEDKNNNNSDNKDAEKGSGGGDEVQEQEAAAKKGDGNGIINVEEEEGMKRMMHYYQPFYVIERIPPPQLFSDENPNACCIS